MNLVSSVADRLLGLCRKPPALRSMQADFVHLPGIAHEGIPDGGSGGSGILHRGIGAAFSGMRTLNRNRQLLWFSLLTGLVLAGNAVAEGALWYINRTLQPDSIGLYVQDFFLSFATLFCLLILLAGLVVSLSSQKDGHALFFEGLAGAKKYVKPLLLWSMILALAGILLFRIWVGLFTGMPPEFRFLLNFGPYFFDSMITQFPFNWTLDWAMLTEIPGYGGRTLLLLIYPFGFMRTMNFLVITLLMFVMTPFVVPLIVIEKKTLIGAVMGSFAMMKKTWAEIISCAIFLGIIVSGMFLTYLLVQAVSGIVDPYNTVMFHPTIAWITFAVIFNLALVTIAFVTATVGGIASLHIYRNAGTQEGSV